MVDVEQGEYDLWHMDGRYVKRAVSPDGISWLMTGTNQTLSGLFLRESDGLVGRGMDVGRKG